MQRVSETMVLTLFILLYFLLTQSSWTQLKVRVQVWTQLKGQENEDRSVSGTVGGASGGTIGGVSGSGTDWLIQAAESHTKAIESHKKAVEAVESHLMHLEQS
ncbi:hypothetical protein JHK86_048637 [Glycine max]|nr:hypothetical protein JHK86_048637 [Glycine max]